MHELRRILVGVDLHSRGKGLRRGSAKALEQATWLARKVGGQLTLLHSTWVDGDEPDESSLADESRAALEAAAEQVRADDVPCTVRVTTERSWRAITHAVLRGESDLVVVGKREEEEGDSRRLGTVAVKLLRKCPSPVWVVKPEHDLVHRLVLAASDCTPVGNLAVQYGAYVAARHDCDFHVVHAYSVPMQLQLESSRLSEEEYAARIEEIRAKAQSTIKACLESCELERDAQIHVGRNKPSSAIKEAVEHLHPDLLVMGSVSRGGVPGLLVGNTAEKLLDRVDCSILTVKPADFVSPVELE